jgi:hypothetical protein
MYTQVVQEEDNKMAEGYQKKADVTLIFVSPMLTSVRLYI